MISVTTHVLGMHLNLISVTTQASGGVHLDLSHHPSLGAHTLSHYLSLRGCNPIWGHPASGNLSHHPAQGVQPLSSPLLTPCVIRDSDGAEANTLALGYGSLTLWLKL